MLKISAKYKALDDMGGKWMRYGYANGIGLWYNKALVACPGDAGNIPGRDARKGTSRMDTPISHRANNAQAAVCLNCNQSNPVRGFYLILSDIAICHDCHQLGRHCSRCRKFFNYDEMHGRVHCPTCNDIRQRQRAGLPIEIAENATQAIDEVVKEAKPARVIPSEVLESRKAIARDLNYQRKYGITHAEYDAMLAQQAGVCAICKKPPKAGKVLCVDHDHKTGRIRQLLCGPCNNLLGAAGDDIEVLRHAIAYLERHK